MKNSNCGNCPHLHRCRATNNDECIDTIIGRKHYMSNKEKQIRADAISEYKHNLKETFNNEFPINYQSKQSYFTLDDVRVLADAVAREMKEQSE